MKQKKQNLEKEFFNQLADKLEEFFEKGEKCQCGRRLPCRSKALTFNAYANIFLKEVLAKQKEEILKKVEKLSEDCECDSCLAGLNKGNAKKIIRLSRIKKIIQ